MKKEFKYPCAVETDSLVGNQGNELQEAFIKLGASLYDEYRARRYYGVDIDGDTQYYSTLHSFAGGDEEVILYTYEEIMSFVAKLEQPEEAPVTKRQLEFPCAIAMSEITSQEVYDKVFNAFIEAGARDRENYNDPDGLGCQYEYFGVNSNQETVHWNNLEDYDADDCSNGYVAIYCLEDILGGVDNKEPIREETPNIETSDEPQFKVACTQTYTLTIKGVIFELTSDEFTELERAMEDF
jgi:hypothetical protein